MLEIGPSPAASARKPRSRHRTAERRLPRRPPWRRLAPRRPPRTPPSRARLPRHSAASHGIVEPVCMRPPDELSKATVASKARFQGRRQRGESGSRTRPRTVAVRRTARHKATAAAWTLTAATAPAPRSTACSGMHAKRVRPSLVLAQFANRPYPRRDGRDIRAPPWRPKPPSEICNPCTNDSLIETTDLSKPTPAPREARLP